jgi:transcription initiation factor TFIIIB Brf1 subunit/transcription initiation factor TFIIB
MKCPHCGADEVAHSPNAYWCKACGHFLTPPEADAATEASNDDAQKPSPDSPQDEGESKDKS